MVLVTLNHEYGDFLDTCDSYSPHCWFDVLEAHYVSEDSLLQMKLSLWTKFKNSQQTDGGISLRSLCVSIAGSKW
jgi:hypothetical protein